MVAPNALLRLLSSCFWGGLSSLILIILTLTAIIDDGDSDLPTHIPFSSSPSNHSPGTWWTPHGQIPVLLQPK